MEYFEKTQSNTEVLTKETLISPGFYTINIRKLSNIDTLSFQEAFNTAVANLKSDYTKDKYIRDERFNQSWDHTERTTLKSDRISFCQKVVTLSLNLIMLVINVVTLIPILYEDAHNESSLHKGGRGSRGVNICSFTKKRYKP